MKIVKTLCLIVTVSIIFQACGSDEEIKKDQNIFGIFTVQEDGTTVLSNGTIDTRTLTDFNNMLTAYPDINLINIQEMPGSMDDETNVQIGPKIYQRNINTHLLDGGLIASGGVDFYLAGRKRSLGQNTMIGVHSWASGNQEATDFADDSPEHDLFLDYYKAIGFDDVLARSFYFFTIKAASADNIHYMTPAEIEQYKMER